MDLFSVKENLKNVKVSSFSAQLVSSRFRHLSSFFSLHKSSFMVMYVIVVTYNKLGGGFDGLCEVIHVPVP